MKEIELKIPSLGEAEDTEIIEISVKKGEKLKKNDPIIVLESEKAAMEVPSDYDGVIKEIVVSEGDSVKEGVVFAIIEVDEINEKLEDKSNQKTENAPKEKKDSDFIAQNIERDPITFHGINAGPAVRKIARELQIDLNRILGSGRNKMITKDDLKDYIHSEKLNSNESYAEVENLEKFGDFNIINQSKIKKLGAKNLSKSWTSIPHVSHFEEADITKIEGQRNELNRVSSVKITPLTYILKATSIALKDFPLMNSALVGEGKIMIRKYINIGIAVNTENGLVVPVIKDIDQMKIGQIAEEIIMLSTKAREKKLIESDIEGATFTISSLGNIGGVGFSPIINPPEVGIIGISRSKKIISFENEKAVQKIILPFSLSYDHRVINGVDAGNFMNNIKTIIERGL